MFPKQCRFCCLCFSVIIPILLPMFIPVQIRNTNPFWSCGTKTAMCHKSFDPRFLYMWPCGQYSIMGGQQAADVLAEVASMGKEWTDEEKANYKKKVFDQYTLEGSPYYNTARVWNDGVIDPKDTRKILGLSLSVALNGKKQETKWGTLRM